VSSFGLALVFYLVWLVIVAAIASVGYYWLTSPLRRRERARVFLRVLEVAAERGQSAERVILDLGEQEPRPWFEIGWRFSRLKKRIQKGEGLVAALRKVPGFLPRQVVEILAVGERLGDLRKVLPAAHRVIADARPRTRAAINYFVLITCFAIVAYAGIVGFGPRWAVLPTLRQYVIPQMENLLKDIGGGELPPVFAVATSDEALWAVLALAAFFFIITVFYVFGQRLKAYALVRYPGDVVSEFLPWSSKRLKRDFSAMLAVLLDAGVPEAEAVTLAARSTGNWVFLLRGKLVVRALARGRKLTDAVAWMDRSGEFRWRLANAVHVRAGFLEALAGWHEALDAKADEEEQSAAHVITTALLLLNAAAVGLLAIGLFQALIALVYKAAMW